MRLIKTATLEFIDVDQRQPPSYAILSHTWEGKEVTFKDINELSIDKLEAKYKYKKIVYACSMAFKKGLEYIWIDTCCINKENEIETSTAINSMFDWYQNADVCFVYLSDLRPKSKGSTPEDFKKCRWFTRGWTLQELIAPRKVLFFDEAWEERGEKTHPYNLDIICAITRISRDVICDPNNLGSFSAAQKMSWAANRETTYPEDMAYCLYGIFGINMPLLHGSRAAAEAFSMLQMAILIKHNDLSLLGWDSMRCSKTKEGSLLAPSPKAFAACGGDTQIQKTSNYRLSHSGECLHFDATNPLPLYFAELPKELVSYFGSARDPIVGLPRYKPKGQSWKNRCDPTEIRYVLPVSRDADTGNVNGICLRKLDSETFVRETKAPLVQLDPNQGDRLAQSRFSLAECWNQPFGVVACSINTSAYSINRSAFLRVTDVWPTASWDHTQLALFYQEHPNNIPGLSVQIPIGAANISVEVLFDCSPQRETGPECIVLDPTRENREVMAKSLRLIKTRGGTWEAVTKSQRLRQIKTRAGTWEGPGLEVKLFNYVEVNIGDRVYEVAFFKDNNIQPTKFNCSVRRITPATGGLSIHFYQPNSSKPRPEPAQQ